MAAAEFDSIADVYDETRRPLDGETLNGIDEMLEKHGCRSVLEIGVGTGRVSVPLTKNGYEVVGVDLSKRMMERARTKGIKNLVLAEGGRTPFREQIFDAVLMAHVFHLLQEPMAVMHEAARVSRVGVFALVRKGVRDRPWLTLFGGGPPVINESGNDESTKRLFEQRRERFRQIAEKYHWSWDSSHRLRNWGREQELLETHPPDDLEVVSDIVINETVEERIARFEKGGFSFASRMPEEMRKELVSEMRASASSYPRLALQARHEVYQVAMWRSKSLLL